MGINISGNTDIISATDGSLTIQGADFTAIAAGSTAAPSISPTGDSNTGIFFPSADTIAFGEGGAEAARFDSSGRLLLGTSTARSNFFNSTNTAMYQVEGTGAGTSSARASIAVINNNVNSDDDSSYLILARSYGSAAGGNDLVTNGGRLGQISFQGADGTEFVEGASIQAVVDGTSGANDLPTRLVFSVTADGASSTTERMRIRNNGETRFFSNNNTSTLELRNASSSGTTNRLLFGVHSATNNTDGTAIYSIFTNGTTGTPSDIRLKKNVELTRDGYLEDVANLRVVKYHWKTQDDSEPKELGLIAQEVEQVFPGLIRTEGEGENEIKELKRSVIPFILLKALQEADAKIKAQQVVINDLLARVTALESA